MPLALMLFASQATSRAQDLNLLLQDQLGGLGQVASGGEVEFTGSFKLKTDTGKGILSLVGNIPKGWHVFSVTQQSGGPIASTITVAESDQYKAVGKFTADTKPHIHNVEYFTVPIEEHEGKVTWSVPIEVAGGFCKQINDVEIDAAFAGFDDDLQVQSFVHKPAKITKYLPPGIHVQLQGRVVRADGTDAPFAPGDKAILELTAKALEDFHIYTYSLEEPSGSMPTIVGFTQTNDWTVKGDHLDV